MVRYGAEDARVPGAADAGTVDVDQVTDGDGLGLGETSDGDGLDVDGLDVEREGVGVWLVRRGVGDGLCGVGLGTV